MDYLKTYKVLKLVTARRTHAASLFGREAFVDLASYNLHRLDQLPYNSFLPNI